MLLAPIPVQDSQGSLVIIHSQVIIHIRRRLHNLFIDRSRPMHGRRVREVAGIWMKKVEWQPRGARLLLSLPQRGSDLDKASSVRDDDSLISFSNVPSYMARTQSSKAKVRSQSTPKQRPITPEEVAISSCAKKRLSFPPVVDSFVGASGPSKPTNRPLGPQRSPSLKGHSGPLKYGRYLDEVSFDSSASWNGDFRRHFR